MATTSDATNVATIGIPWPYTPSPLAPELVADLEAAGITFEDER